MTASSFRPLTAAGAGHRPPAASDGTGAAATAVPHASIVGPAPGRRHPAPGHHGRRSRDHPARGDDRAALEERPRATLAARAHRAVPRRTAAAASAGRHGTAPPGAAAPGAARRRAVHGRAEP
ncbi:hypothetical protein A6P39_007510 [Streptomyces sp. FXJ1.172]|uniref:hypothetical protein n=1 Tax=Streptomyces sp. FXJ1.172 TaxID=710705 RepID=UPI00133122C0|nr:hypothetical protein [Streptomyces sp. FXJ1.172]WEO93866.1 hypothetical protein A6P39_007510 [Streptomyces sp. FXJ1.172]